MTAAPDLTTLTALLQHHVDPAAECVAVTRAAVGNSQETWFIDVAGVESPATLVLRRSAVAGTLEWSDRAAEVDVLNAVRHAGLPVPRVWWWEPDGGTLDRAYLMMDRAEGHAPDLRDPAVADELAADLGRWLARLHRLAEAPASLRTGETTATEASRRQVELWTERARSTGVAPPTLLALAGWLLATVPDDDSETRLLWGDPGPHNVLVDDAGHVTALLDWELSHIGHPLLDVGAARWSCLGQLDREVLTATYEAELGIAVDRHVLGWFEVLACVSRSVMLCDGVRAAIEGRAHDPNMAGLAVALASANMLRAARIAWDIGPSTAASGPPATTTTTTPLRPTPAETVDVLARFLTTDVLPAVSDPRLRRGLKISAALLASVSELAPAVTTTTDIDWFDAERAGRLTDTERQRLVDEMASARRSYRPLIDLYGRTVDVGEVRERRSAGDERTQRE